MMLPKGSVAQGIERIVTPVVLAALLVVQVVHLVVEGARAQVPLYSGLYTILDVDRLFLPVLDGMKSLAIQVGARQGLRLDDRNVDVDLVLDTLRVSVRMDDNHDWQRFFVNYREALQRATLARCREARLARANACDSLSPMTFRGWSSSRGSLIKPLDVASMAALSAALFMWVFGPQPGGPR
jgi:hypothetical protein